MHRKLFVEVNVWYLCAFLRLRLEYLLLLLLLAVSTKSKVEPSWVANGCQTLYLYSGKKPHWYISLFKTWNWWIGFQFPCGGKVVRGDRQMQRRGRGGGWVEVNRMSVIEVLPMWIAVEIVCGFYFVGEIGIVWGFGPNKPSIYARAHNTHCGISFIC